MDEDGVRSGDSSRLKSPSETVEILLDEGPQLPHDSEASEEDEVDLELYEAGRRYFSSNFFSLFACMLTGLLCLLYTESIALVLHFTGRSSSPGSAFLRYLGTLQHTLTWYKDKDSLRHSLRVVRAMHSRAGSLAMSKGRLMSQRDMVLTQWGFIGPALVFPQELGISIPDKKGEEGLVYVMYLVGQYLGVQDSLNLCSGGAERAKLYSKLVLERIVRPCLEKDTQGVCKDMTRHLLDGVNVLNPFIDQNAFHAWARRLLLTKETFAMEDLSHLVGFSLVMYKTKCIVFSNLLGIPIFGAILRFLANKLMLLNIVLAAEFKDFMAAGLKNEERGMGIFWPRGRLMAFLVIPPMAAISASKFIRKKVERLVTSQGLKIFLFGLVMSVLIKRF